MGQPHKHAALIKAWADGAQIQSLDKSHGSSRWQDTEHPNWFNATEYRIKPKIIRYRLALWLFYGEPIVNSFSDEQYTNHPCFIRWLTDWQEVEI